MFPEPTVATFSDEDIRNEIENAWWGHVELRQSHQQLRASVSGGRARLTGVVTSHMLKAIAVRLAEIAPGVSALDDAIVVDSDLAVAVARAIAEASPPVPAEELGIQVIVYKGTVSLVGTVREAAEGESIVKAARGVRGVLDVVNRLVVQ